MDPQRKYREKLIFDLQQLQRQYRELMVGKVMPTPKAMAVKRKMIAIEAECRKLDCDAADRMALSRAPIDEVLEIVALPLLADVMNDMVARVDGMLRKYGTQGTVFGIYTSQIRTAALAMVDTLDQAEAGLPRLLDVDDTLVEAIHKKLMSFIRRRLRITDR